MFTRDRVGGKIGPLGRKSSAGIVRGAAVEALEQRMMLADALTSIQLLGSEPAVFAEVLNEPLDIVLSGNTIGEHRYPGEAVGTFSTISADTGGTFSYSLVSGIGGEDNEFFAIDGDRLKSAAAFDYLDKSSYSIRVRTTDGGGGSLEKAFTVTVTGLFAAPENSGNWNLPLYPTAGNADAAVSADFNGDARPDLAILTRLSSGNVVPGTISVMMGNGDGSFAAKVDYPAGILDSLVLSMTSGDFNGDGKPDLVVPTSSGVSVLLNNGDGTFAARLDHVTGVISRAVTAADFSGDGLADLAVVGGDEFTRVLMSNGDGTFAAPLNYAIWGMVITAADFTGDGKPDLAIIGWEEARILANNGDGILADWVSCPLPTGTFFAVTAADFDGNGTVDLAAGHSSDGYVSVLRNNGDGTFAATTDYATPDPDFDMWSLASGDFNGDGRADLAGGGWGADLNVFLNRGDGTFADGITFAGWYGCRTVTAADFNGDDRTDLAAGCGYKGAMEVWMNTFTPPAVLVAKPPTATGSGPTSITQADFDGDGDQDIAVANQNSNTLGILLNNGDDSFAAEVSYPAGLFPISVVSGDLDGGGDIDLAVTNGDDETVSIFLNNGDGTFAARFDYVTMSYPGGVVFGDFSGDGKPDLAVASGNGVSVLLNTGSGTFADKIDYVTGSVPWSVTSGDFDGNGKLDLAVANYGDSTVSVLVNVGEGAFAAPVQYATGAGPYSVASADFNGDGKADLATANQDDGTVSVLRNLGDGTFAVNVDFAAGSLPQSLAPGDFDDDGKTDLVVANNGDNTVGVLFNRGDGTFANMIASTTENNPSSLAPGDFNGDGKLDVAVANYGSDTVSILRNIANKYRPTDLALSPVTTSENQPAGTAVGTLDTSDGDTGDTFIYRFVDGDGSSDNSNFVISGDQLLTAAVFDFEAKSSYSIRVRTTDALGYYFEKAITVTVSNVNEAPTNVVVSAGGVSENQPAGITVGAFTSTDPDAWDNLIYTLVSGDGSDDNASFTISGNELKTAAGFDYETKSSYMIRIRTTDAGGLWFEKSFTINVIDVDESVPQVVGVYVRGSTWTSGFMSYLGTSGLGSNTLGYAVPVGSGSQLRTLPWSNINRISVVFSKDVLVQREDLILNGINLGSYGIASSTFTYDDATFTATWTLPASIARDKIRLVLNADGTGAITDASGVRLDGDWANPASTASTGTDTYPSGNGIAGGNFDFRFNVLPGDVNQNGVVQATDGVISRNLLNRSTASVGYSIFVDSNGNGVIQATDGAVARFALNQSLPSGEPLGGAFSNELLRARMSDLLGRRFRSTGAGAVASLITMTANRN